MSSNPCSRTDYLPFLENVVLIQIQSVTDMYRYVTDTLRQRVPNLNNPIEKHTIKYVGSRTMYYHVYSQIQINRMN